MDEPVFANSLGGLRDPKNTRRDFRAALGQSRLRVGDDAQLQEDDGHAA